MQKVMKVIMKKTIKYLTIVIIFALSVFPAFTSGGNVHDLKSIDYTNNETLRSIRKDIKKTIFTVMSKRDPAGLPDLKFYRYRVKKGENFWIVLSKSGLDMDTLISVNLLTSPYQVGEGTVLFIPNMRGVVVTGDDKDGLTRVLSESRVKIDYVRRANKSESLEKDFVFIPCGRVSGLERSMFLGSAFLSPIKIGRTTSGFGSRKDPFNENKAQFHRGVDIGCPIGTKIYSARAGRVTFAGYADGYGKLVILEHEHGYTTYYGHLSGFTVKQGDKVGAGQSVAFSGNTGRTTGPHIHFEIRRHGRALNPRTFIRGIHR
jgi:murein DD-endopeptidase MepM/ murein hydrolase activator NlpD